MIAIAVIAVLRKVRRHLCLLEMINDTLKVVMIPKAGLAVMGKLKINKALYDLVFYILTLRTGHKHFNRLSSSKAI